MSISQSLRNRAVVIDVNESVYAGAVAARDVV